MTPRPPATRGVLAVVAAGTVLALAACTAPNPSLDFDGILTEDDAPPGMTWTESAAELTAGEDFETFEHQWADSAGEPESCLPMYLVPYGLLANDEGSTDRTVEVGYLVHDSLDGSILVNAREFPDERDAVDYLDYVLEVANDCPGYEISGLRVAPDGFAPAPFDGGEGLSIDGGHVADGVTTRTAIVRVGRTIIVVDAFLQDAAAFDPGVVDEIARAILASVDTGP